MSEYPATLAGAFEHTCEDVLTPFPDEDSKNASREWFYAGAMAVVRLITRNPGNADALQDELTEYAKKELQKWRPH
jgi:hypothetical protein